MHAIPTLSPVASLSGAVAIAAPVLDTVVAPVMPTPAIDPSFPLVNAYSTIVHLTRDRLVRSTMNVRQRGADVTELAALIRSQGLLQNLIGYKQRRNGIETETETGMVEIVAGGRRLDALDVLIIAEELPEQFEIPVLLVSEDEAIDISLAENSGREAMHPADVFDAMLAMAAAGRTAGDIGIAFGIDALRVKRRLKLAKVSTRLLTLYRNDKATIEQMTALALVDRHDQQEKVWDALPEYQRSASNLRRLLTQGHVEGKHDSVARFVGVGAYEAAGGVVLRDLFSDHDEGYLQDLPLLESLALAKLEVQVHAIESEGRYAWVEARLRVGYDDLSTFGHAATTRAPAFDKQQAELAKIAAKLEKIAEQREAAFDADDEILLATLDEQEANAERRLRDIEDSLVCIDPSTAALVGALVTIDRDGAVQVHRNLIRPGDKQSLKTAVATVGTERPAHRAVHSERLVKMLTSHRTMALAAELMHQPHVALAILTNELMASTFGHHRDALAKIRADRPSLADEVKGSAAHNAIEAQREVLKDLIQTRNEDQSPLAWLLVQPQEKLMALMAFCVACSVDAVQGSESHSQKFTDAADAVNLDMRTWWSASTANYFDHVAKARTIEVVSLAVSPEAATPLQKMKKQEAAHAAQRAVEAMQWLPELLQASVTVQENGFDEITPDNIADKK